jgi:hypothetical protein
VNLEAYKFYLLKGSGSLLLFLILCITLLLHRRQSFCDIVLVALTKLMCSDAEWIVRYKYLAQVAPFVSLAHPILEYDR